MNVFICGGSGYLGGVIANALCKKNNVIVGTRFPKNIKNYNKKIKIIKINYLSKKSLQKALKNIDVIFHLVGMNKQSSIDNPKKSLELKKKVTLNIAEAARKNNCSKLIYLSSIQVYKNFFFKKIISENSKIFPSNSYSKAHLNAEKILYLNKKNLNNIIIIRSSSIFGTNIINKSKELLFTLVNNFCYQAVKNKKIIVKDRNIVRNFVPSSILIKFINIILKKKFLKNYQIYNLGYKSFSLEEICNLIIERYNKLFNTHCELILRNKKNNENNIIVFTSLLKNFKFSKKIFFNELDNLLKIFKKAYVKKKPYY